MDPFGRALRRGGAALTVWVLALLLISATLSPALWARGHESAVVAAAIVTAAELPPEARQTLRLIREGGPFPFERDGVVFRNLERMLPSRDKGYYREYTVITPGLKHRGARRIIAGRGGELYYTDDHYGSFRRIRE